MLKEQSQTQPKTESTKPGDKISGLKTTAFNFMPGTVNNQRGGTVNIHDDTILWSKNDDAPPIPLCKQDEKHVSISQVHLAIQYSPTSSIRMTKIPTLVIQGIHSSVI